MNKLFKKIELSDRDIIESILEKKPKRLCDLCFANIYLWSRDYPTSYAVMEGAVVFHPTDSEEYAFAFPTGEKECVKAAVVKLIEMAENAGEPIRFFLCMEEDFAWMEEWFPGQYKIEYDDDYSDYVYETEKLVSLSGKKYHGKKNHVNKFMKTYPDWTYEEINDDNEEECFQMAMNWRNDNGVEEDQEKRSEMTVTMNALRLRKELHLTGGLIRAEGKVVAFSLGEPIGQETYAAHIEKAYAEVPGAYSIINQQFALHAASEYKYLNREDAAGSEGLKRAKESYRPVYLLRKGLITAKS